MHFNISEPNSFSTPSLPSTYNTVHCVGKRTLFVLTSWAIFLFWFRYSNDQQSYDHFTLFQGTRWILFLPIYRCHNLASRFTVLLVVLFDVHRLLSIQLTADLTQMWNGWSIHCHNDAEMCSDCQTAFHHWHDFLFGPVSGVICALSRRRTQAISMFGFDVLTNEISC